MGVPTIMMMYKKLPYQIHYQKNDKNLKVVLTYLYIRQAGEASAHSSTWCPHLPIRPAAAWRRSVR